MIILKNGKAILNKYDMIDFLDEAGLETNSSELEEFAVIINEIVSTDTLNLKNELENKQSEIDSLEDKIEDLQDTIDNLKNELSVS